VKHVKDAKVAVFGCAVDTSSTETKGTVLITSAKDLESYSLGEEQKMEEYVKMIADSGAKVVVSGQSFGEMAMHFIERYGLMAIKMPSKFELRRFCRATNATGIIKLGRPSADELGYVSSIDVREIGGTKCVVVQQNDATSPRRDGGASRLHGERHGRHRARGGRRRERVQGADQGLTDAPRGRRHGD
jgi:T-complex protein 1 subunit theta